MNCIATYISDRLQNAFTLNKKTQYFNMLINSNFLILRKYLTLHIFILIARFQQWNKAIL
jgi:hypothetical protein